MGGESVTRPLTFAGDRLELHVDTSAAGTVLIEIQDKSGDPIRGFAASDADEINANSVRKTVTWNGSDNLGSLAGKLIRLRFVMRDTKLYAFNFTPAKKSRAIE